MHVHLLLLLLAWQSMQGPRAKDCGARDGIPGSESSAQRRFHAKM